MSLNDQIKKIKDNWLIVAVLVIFFFVFSGFGSIGNISNFSSKGMAQYDMMESSRSYAPSYGGGYYGNEGDFAPDVEERIVIKDSYMTSEVDKGSFRDAESEFKSIVSSSGSYLLNENVNANGEGWKKYYTGYFTIKVPTGKYDEVIGKLKEIGDVKNFRENARDVTGTHTNLQSEIDAEKARLARYQTMFDSTEDESVKFEITDKIYDLELRIERLEKSLNNIDQRVDYSQVSYTLNEKRSEWINITLVKLSDLIRSLVNSFNGLLHILFIVFPWAVAFLILRFIWKIVKR